MASASDLVDLVKKLGAPFGLERSVKITPGGLDHERCLLSVGRAAFGDTAENPLLDMARALQIPQAFADRLPATLKGADIIHFGYEGGGGRGAYKIYFEYANAARRAMQAVNGTPTLVHVAYKWTPGHADNDTVTRYTWVPSRTSGELEMRLRSLVPEDQAPHARRCLFGLLSRISGFADAGEVLLMEVEEPGNPRRSCDLNVYDAEMRIGQIVDLIEGVMTGLSVPQAEHRDVFDRAADKALGHVSAGVGRDGREFVTIYFGVEAH
jgi:tryptophan 7-halogenase